MKILCNPSKFSPFSLLSVRNVLKISKNIILTPLPVSVKSLYMYWFHLLKTSKCSCMSRFPMYKHNDSFVYFIMGQPLLFFCREKILTPKMVLCCVFVQCLPVNMLDKGNPIDASPASSFFVRWAENWLLHIMEINYCPQQKYLIPVHNMVGSCMLK